MTLLVHVPVTSLTLTSSSTRARLQETGKLTGIATRVLLTSSFSVGGFPSPRPRGDAPQPAPIPFRHQRASNHCANICDVIYHVVSPVCLFTPLFLVSPPTPTRNRASERLHTFRRLQRCIGTLKKPPNTPQLAPQIIDPHILMTSPSSHPLTRLCVHKTIMTSYING